MIGPSLPFYLMLENLKLPSLQERRKQLRLLMMYKVVEGLVPALPPSQFLAPQKQGRRIRIKKDTDFTTTNTISSFVRNNDRCFVVPTSRTEQYKQSFFSRTVTEWNALDDSVVHAENTLAFKTSLGTAIKDTSSIAPQ